MRLLGIIAVCLGLVAVIVGVVSWWTPSEIEDPMDAVYLTVAGGVCTVCALLLLSLFGSPGISDSREPFEWGDSRPPRIPIARSSRAVLPRLAVSSPPARPRLPPFEEFELGPVVAERHFVLHSGGDVTRDVLLKVGQPALGDLGWVCPWVLEQEAQLASAYLTYRGRRRLGFGELCLAHLRERKRRRRHRHQRGTVVVPTLSPLGPSPD